MKHIILVFIILYLFTCKEYIYVDKNEKKFNFSESVMLTKPINSNIIKVVNENWVYLELDNRVYLYYSVSGGLSSADSTITYICDKKDWKE